MNRNSYCEGGRGGDDDLASLVKAFRDEFAVIFDPAKHNTLAL